MQGRDATRLSNAGQGVVSWQHAPTLRTRPRGDQDHASITRCADRRVVASDVRIGDELAVGAEWRRAVKRAEYGAVVEPTCDDPPDAGPRAYDRHEPS